MTTSEPTGVVLPIEWHVPDDVLSRYATNLQVHHTKHEFIISFFEAQMPPITGDADEILDQIEKMGPVRAECVARITVAASRMAEFVQALQDNLDGYLSRIGDSR